MIVQHLPPGRLLVTCNLHIVQQSHSHSSLQAQRCRTGLASLACST